MDFDFSKFQYVVFAIIFFVLAVVVPVEFSPLTSFTSLVITYGFYNLENYYYVYIPFVGYVFKYLLDGINQLKGKIHLTIVYLVFLMIIHVNGRIKVKPQNTYFI